MKARFILPALSAAIFLFLYSCRKEPNVTTTETPTNALPVDIVKVKQDIQKTLQLIQKIQGTNPQVQTRDAGQFIVVPAGSVDAIKQALSDAGDNGTVYLRSGLHTENTGLVIKSKALLVGELGAVLKIKSSPSVPGSDGLIPLNPAIHVLNAGSSAILNISIQPLDGDGSTGILFENSPFSASMYNTLNGFQFSIVVEKSDNPVIMGNKVVGSTLSSRGGIPVELGILVMNGKSAWVAQNEASGNLHGIFVCDKYGTATQNYVHDNFIGLTLCAFGGVKLPSGQATGGQSPATNWKINGNRSENNTTDGFLVIHGANDNTLQNNSTTGNGGADIDLTGKTNRFGFPADASYNNSVTATTSQKIQDCGNNNKVSGGTLSSLPCIDSYSNDVAVKWSKLQMELTRTTAGYNAGSTVRVVGYLGLTLYESIAPGVSNYQSLASQVGISNPAPSYDAKNNYYLPASANAAMASVTKSFFSAASAATKVTIDSLEADFVNKFQSQSTTEELNRSIAIGREVATNIFEWSKTDGALTVYPTYVPPVGPGLWIPTPPAFASAAIPYTGNNRSFIKDIATNLMIPPPVPYSEDPQSDFYKMANEVYTTSLTLTARDTVTVKYWTDIAGVLNVPAHFTNILTQIIEKEKLPLFEAAIAYAKQGIAIREAGIVLFKSKYTYNLERPITYIRTVLNHPTWNSVLPTPANPEYSSAKIVTVKAVSTVLENIFGTNYSFIDNTYNNLYGSRNYDSFSAFVEDVVAGRLLAGYTYKPTAVTSLAQGQKVGDMVNAIKFRK